jgi:hypothetical protein
MQMVRLAGGLRLLFGKITLGMCTVCIGRPHRVVPGSSVRLGNPEPTSSVSRTILIGGATLVPRSSVVRASAIDTAQRPALRYPYNSCLQHAGFAANVPGAPVFANRPVSAGSMSPRPAPGRASCSHHSDPTTESQDEGNCDAGQLSEGARARARSKGSSLRSRGNASPTLLRARLAVRCRHPGMEAGR